MLKGKNRRGLQSINSDLACQFERPLSRKTPVELCPAACITNAMGAIATLLAPSCSPQMSLHWSILFLVGQFEKASIRFLQTAVFIHGPYAQKKLLDSFQNEV